MTSKEHNEFRDKWVEKKGLCAIEGFELVEKEHFHWWGAIGAFVVATLVFTIFWVILVDNTLPDDGADNDLAHTTGFDWEKNPMLKNTNYFFNIAAAFALVIGLFFGAYLAKDNKTWEFERVADRKEVLKIIPDKTEASGYRIRKSKE